MGEKKTVMSEELAEKEFVRWAEGHGIDLTSFEGEKSNVFQGSRRRVVNAFMNGSLVLEDTGILEYTVSALSPEGYAGEKVKIRGMTGKAWMAMDKFKAEEQIHQLVATASAVTGKDMGWFSNLANPDFLLFTNVVALFTNA